MEQNGGNTVTNSQPGNPGVATSQVSTPPPSQQSTDIVAWHASEFIDHQKNSGWFLLLLLAIAVLGTLVYFVTKDILATLVIVMGGAAFFLFARQKPRTLSYSLSQTNITVGDKQYSYDDFKTFSIVQEGAIYSVFLEPIKRFLPPLSIYFPPEDGEKIFDALASHIPHQERQIDPVERLMSRIRF